MSEVQATTEQFKSLTDQMVQLQEAVFGGQQKIGLFEAQQRKLNTAIAKNPLVNMIQNLGRHAKAISNVTKFVANNTTMTKKQRDDHVKNMTVMQKMTSSFLLFGGVARANNKILLVANNRFTRLATRLFSLVSILAIIGFALVAFSVAVDGAATPLLGMTEDAGALHDAIQGLVLILTGEGDEEGAAAAFDILAAAALTAGAAFVVFSAPVALVIGAVTAAVGVFQLVKAETGNMSASILAAVGSFSALVGVGLTLKLMFTNLIGATSTAVAGSVGAIMVGIGGVLAGLAGLVAFAMGAGEGIKAVALAVGSAILVAVGLVVAGIALPVAAIVAAVALVVAVVVRNWDAIKATLAAGWNWLKSTGRAVGSFFGRGMTAIFTFRQNLIRGLMGMLTTAGSNIRKWLGNLARNIADWLGKRKDQLIALPGTVKDGFLTAMRDMLNAIIGVYNDFAAGMQFDIPEWVPKIGGQVFELPAVPMLAKGGIVSKPTLAMIGEDGPEAVVPLSSKNNPGGIGLGGGDVTVNINVAGVTDRTDKKELAREIGDLIRSEMTRSGRSFGNRRSAV